MVIVFADLASEKYPVKLLRRLFKKLAFEIPGTVVSKEWAFIPDETPEKPEARHCWTFIGAIQSKGYATIELEGRTHLVHRLMYDIFKHGLMKGLQIHHVCYKRNCVNPFHLLQVTSKQHTECNMSQGRQASGERHGNHKLTEAQVIDLLEKHESGGYTIKQLAQMFGLSKGGVKHIIYGDCWKHLRGKHS